MQASTASLTNQVEALHSSPYLDEPRASLTAFIAEIMKD